ncbi:hypothetical protein OS123_10060 [Corynebacterium sp. P5875]|uniref:Uncharacterized protein n=1 Tax=Corynebacterium antarcticum TaxID=2800405 RepID=A0A9Q4CDH8_9CORY|nr:hypothetical protein [Corynebacterium antarcticum]MCX7538876.1 hypothetical protein [Corynebacterium antarcticum]
MDIAHQLGAFSDIIGGIVKVFGNMPESIFQVWKALRGFTALEMSAGTAAMSLAQPVVEYVAE